MRRSGYWGSAWPVECGANHRPKVAASGGLDLQPTDRLVATTRHTGRWPVMFVQRQPGELYLHGTTTGDDPTVAGWVELVDPVSLRPLASSGDLPAGGHEWCGSLSAHANGDLYTVNGSYLHRLRPDCSVATERQLPVDHAHNGLLILDDGAIVTKDIRLGDQPSTLTVCDPDLAVLTTVQLPEASMGRLAAVGDELYVPGSTRLFRYRWDGARLEADPTWRPAYRDPAAADPGGLSWDTTLVGGRAWLMDNGSLPAIEQRFAQIPARRVAPGPASAVVSQTVPWSQPVRALGISLTDPADVVEVAPTQLPAGWVIAPPLVHDDHVVVWDTGNTGLAAFDVARVGVEGGRPEMLWFQPFRPSMQPLLFADTGELVVNDFRILADNQTSDDLVVLDLATGRMKARESTGATRLHGMFLCPGWDRDLYYCSAGTVARMRVESL